MTDKPAAPPESKKDADGPAKDIPPAKTAASKEAKPEMKSATPPKPEAKPDAKADAKADLKADSKADTRADAKDADATPPTPPKKKSGSFKLVLWLVLLLVVVGAVGLVTLPWWKASVPPALLPYVEMLPQPPAPKSSEMAGRVDGLETQVQALSGMLATLDGKVGGLAPLSGRVDALEANAGRATGATAEQLALLQKRVEELQTQLATLSGLDPDTVIAVAEQNMATSKLVEGLSDRLDAVQAKIEGLGGERVRPSDFVSLVSRVAEVEDMARQAASRKDTALALLLSVSQLREVVDRGAPFDAQLRTVVKVSGEDPTVVAAVNGFAGRAEVGIPARAVLIERFAPLSGDIVRAGAVPEGAADWVQKTVERAMEVVTVRRTDGAAAGGDSVSAIVARAEGKVAAGDLEGAVAELDTLSGAAAEAAAQWLSDAHARLAADAGLAELTADSLARIDALARVEQVEQANQPAPAQMPAAPASQGGN